MTSPAGFFNRSIPAIAVIGVVVLIYWRTWNELGRRWLDASDTYAHGLLVVAISGYLIWKEARDDHPAPANHTFLTGIIVVAASLVWLVAEHSNILAVQSAMLPVILLGALGLTYGKNSLRRYLAPVFAICFALPLWGFLTSTLQDLTIGVVSYALSILGITALIDGAYVYLPSGVFYIATGCAGLNYFVASFAIAFVCAYLWLPSLRVRITFVSAVLVAALVLNWIRVISLIVVGDATGMEHFLIAVDHYYYGWVLYVGLTILTVLTASRLSDRRKAHDPNDAPADSHEKIETRMIKARLVGILILLSFAPFIAEVLARAQSQLEVTLELPPETLGNWTWSAAIPSGWTVRFPGIADQSITRYVRQDASLDVYMNVYARQSQGRELVSGQNFLLDPAEYRVLHRGPVPPVSDGPKIVATQLHAENRAGESSVLLYWFQLGNARVSTEVEAKWQEIKRFGQTYPAGIIAVRVDCTADCDEERKMLSQFVAEYGEILAQSIRIEARN